MYYYDLVLHVSRLNPLGVIAIVVIIFIATVIDSSNDSKKKHLLIRNKKAKRMLQRKKKKRNRKTSTDTKAVSKEGVSSDEKIAVGSMETVDSMGNKYTK